MKNSIWEYIFKKDSNEGVKDILKELPIFEKLTKRELYHIERLLHRREYQKNESIFNEDEPGAALYIVEDGTVEIYKTIGKEKVSLASLGEKQFFGELALLDDSKRSASAQASVDTTLLAFSHVDFNWIIENSPVIASKILFSLGKLLSQRLRYSNDTLEKLQQELPKNDSN